MAAAIEMMEIKEETIDPTEIKLEPVDEDWELPCANWEHINEDPCIASTSTVAQYATRIKTEPPSDPLPLDGRIPSKEELLYGNPCSINPLLEDEIIGTVKCEPPVMDKELVGSEILRELLLMPIRPTTKNQAQMPLGTKKLLEKQASKHILPPDFCHLPSSNLGSVQSGAGSAMCVIPRDVGLRYIEPAKAAGNSPADSPPPGEVNPTTKNGVHNAEKCKNKVVSEQERLKHVKDQLIKELKKLSKRCPKDHHEVISDHLEMKRQKTHKKVIRSLRKNFRKELHQAAMQLNGENNKGCMSATYPSEPRTLELSAREETHHTDTGNLKPKEEEQYITKQTSKPIIGEEAEGRVVEKHGIPNNQIKDGPNRSILKCIEQKTSKPRIGEEAPPIESNVKPKTSKERREYLNRIILKRIKEGSTQPTKDKSVEKRDGCKYREPEVNDGTIQNFAILKYRKEQVDGEDGVAKAKDCKQAVEEQQEQDDGKTGEPKPKQQWIGSFWGCGLCKEMQFFTAMAFSKHKANFHPNETMLGYFVSSVSCSATSEPKVTTSNITHEGSTQVGIYPLAEEGGELPNDLRTLIVGKIAELSRTESESTAGRRDRHRRNPPNTSSICEFCGKVFTHLGDCNKHRRSHTGERPHVCNFGGCKTSFATHSNLARHRKLHLGVKYRCPMCDTTYSRRDKLVSHAKVCKRRLLVDVEGDGNADGSGGNTVAPSVLTAGEVLKLGAGNGGNGVVFLCRVCNTTFTDVWHFLEHRDSHSADEPSTSEVVVDKPPESEMVVDETSESEVVVDETSESEMVVDED